MTEMRGRFAVRLKALRLKRGLTQQELGRSCGLSTGFISNMERGINAPSFDTLVVLARALGLGIADLFDFES